jgi:hypothetical protein
LHVAEKGPPNGPQTGLRGGPRAMAHWHIGQSGTDLHVPIRTVVHRSKFLVPLAVPPGTCPPSYGCATLGLITDTLVD